MKKKILIWTVLACLFLSSDILAQGPPNPPGDPSAGGGPVGGTAPLGEGVLPLLALAGVYAVKKWKGKITFSGEEISSKTH